jgi:type I restriction enzyme S subunit
MRVKLGDVAIESRETHKGSQHGVPIVGLEHLTPEDVNLAEWDVDTENTFSKRFHKGQVLFGRRRAYLKKAAVAPCDGICSGDITVIAAKPDALAPELLPFLIQNDRFFDFAMEKSAGSLSPRAKWEHLREFEFDLPSMDEQRGLAEVLWAFDDTRQAYKRLIKSTDELVKSQFVEMFGGGDFPKKRIADVCDTVADGDWIEAKDQSDSGVRLVQTGNVGIAEYLDKSGRARYISESTFERLKCTEIFQGDILISRLPDPIGRACELPDLCERMITAVDCTIIRLGREMSSKYFVTFTKTADYALQVAEHSRGATRQRISRKDLENITLPLPPLDLQNRFAEFAAAADKSKFEQTRALDELDAAYKALVRERLG